MVTLSFCIKFFDSDCDKMNVEKRLGGIVLPNLPEEEGQTCFSWHWQIFCSIKNTDRYLIVGSKLKKNIVQWI